MTALRIAGPVMMLAFSAGLYTGAALALLRAKGFLF